MESQKRKGLQWSLHAKKCVFYCKDHKKKEKLASKTLNVSKQKFHFAYQYKSIIYIA